MTRKIWVYAIVCVAIIATIPVIALVLGTATKSVAPTAQEMVKEFVSVVQAGLPSTTRMMSAGCAGYGDGWTNDLPVDAESTNFRCLALLQSASSPDQCVGYAFTVVGGREVLLGAQNVDPLACDRLAVLTDQAL